MLLVECDCKRKLVVEEATEGLPAHLHRLTGNLCDLSGQPGNRVVGNADKREPCEWCRTEDDNHHKRGCLLITFTGTPTPAIKAAAKQYSRGVDDGYRAQVPKSKHPPYILGYEVGQSYRPTQTLTIVN